MGVVSQTWFRRLGKIEWIEKYLRIKKEKMEKFMGKLHRYGDWFAFFSFLPGIGDVIAVASGYFRCRWWIVALSMLLGKFVRYIVWMYLNGKIIAGINEFYKKRKSITEFIVYFLADQLFFMFAQQFIERFPCQFSV